MNKTLGNILKFVIFFAVGFGLLFLVYRQNNKAYLEDCEIKGIPLDECNLIEKVTSDFLGADFLWIFFVFTAYMLSNLSRAARWNMLLRSLGYPTKFWNAFLTTMLGYFANLGFPRLGEFVRPFTLSKYEGVPFDKVIGTIIIDRTMDFLGLFAVIALAVGLEYEKVWGYIVGNGNLEDKIMGVLTNPLFWIAGLVLLGGLFYLFKSGTENALVKKIREFVLGIFDGIKTVAKLKNPLLFIFHSIFIWVMYFFMTYLCFFAFVPTENLTAVAGLVVFVFGTLGMVIPTPGGMGSYHFLVGEGLSLYGIQAADGFSFANIIFFTLQIFGNIFFGILALILLPIINRKNDQKDPQ